MSAYDRVMANPPFSEKMWGYSLWDNGDLAFLQHMVASLKPDGMLGVVVPHGVLFRAGSEGRIREGMLRADIVEAVIGLAPNLFYGAGIPACMGEQGGDEYQMRAQIEDVCYTEFPFLNNILK